MNTENQITNITKSFKDGLGNSLGGVWNVIPMQQIILLGIAFFGFFLLFVLAWVYIKFYK